MRYQLFNGEKTVSNNIKMLKIYYQLCFLVSGLFLLLTIILPFFLDKTGFVSIISDLFGIICHQNPERSIFVLGNSMPLCARCFGMAVGTFAACCVGVLLTPVGSFFDRCMTYFHLPKEEKNLKYLAIILMILMVPMMADGFIQLLTDYESTNVLRVMTGTIFGYARGVLLSSACLTVILYLIKIKNTRVKE